jgi:uncharacterized OB-fold protein
MNQQIPLPQPTVVSAPFWEGTRRRELLVQKCADCGLFSFPPHRACLHCFWPNLDWVAASGRGTVYTYTVIWRPESPAFEVPYVAAIIDMEEGYQMMTNVVDCEPVEVHVGMPVEVDFRDVSDEITLPYFKPRP